MKRTKDSTRIVNVYLVTVEEPDDYYHRPEGVVFIDNQGYFTLYTSDSRHNFLRAAIQKFPYEELEAEVTFQNHQVKLIDVTDQYEPEFDMVLDDMLAILHKVYLTSPRQFFFLEKFFRTSEFPSHFIP